jgi:hypothetical protein
MENQDKFLEEDNLEVTYVVDEQKIISLNKFILLSVISFGLYEIWWIYKAWGFFNQKEKLNINSALRTIFSIIFLIPLFNKILRFAKEKGYNDSYPSILLFIGFFVVNFLAYLPDPFWLIAIFSFVFFLLPFNALNFAKRNSTDFIVTEQTSYNGRQIALIVIGGIFWFLVLLGLIVPN